MRENPSLGCHQDDWCARRRIFQNRFHTAHYRLGFHYHAATATIRDVIGGIMFFSCEIAGVWGGGNQKGTNSRLPEHNFGPWPPENGPEKMLHTKTHLKKF